MRGEEEEAEDGKGGLGGEEEEAEVAGTARGWGGLILNNILRGDQGKINMYNLHTGSSENVVYFTAECMRVK